jgi:hypothetical protein
MSSMAIKILCLRAMRIIRMMRKKMPQTMEKNNHVSESFKTS